MIKFITTSLLTILLIACNNTKKQNSLEQSENVKAKELMQGIWIDDESDIPLLFIKGDTIYYADSQSTPVYFKIIKDTLYTFGNELARYQIDKQTEYSFSFHSLADNIINRKIRTIHWHSLESQWRSFRFIQKSPKKIA